MRDFVKPALYIAIAFLIGVILVNDLGGVLYAQIRAEGVARNISAQAILTYNQTKSEIEASRQGQAIARQNGAILYGWEMKENKLTVWVKVPPRKPLVLGRIFSNFVTATTAYSEFTDIVR